MAENKLHEYFGKTDLLYLIQLIYNEVNRYQLAVEGKGLSTEDFTTALKEKLDGIDISKYAKLDSPALTGTPTAPTATAGTNTTQLATTEFVGTAISNAVSEITGISFTKVTGFDVLPTTGKVGVIYLVPKTKTDTNNIYTEYYWDANTNGYEKLGDTTIDLSNYLKKDDIGELSKDEVKAAWDSVFTAAS
jgi:hypothetical protein